MSKSRDRNTPYLAILLERRPGGGTHVHAGLARHGIGNALCNERQLFEFALAARADGFELYRTDGWRHRWAEAFLEQNRGCQACLTALYQIAREVGWAVPKGLKS